MFAPDLFFKDDAENDAQTLFVYILEKIIH